MKQLRELNKKALGKIKLIVFDVDGVLVPRGTKIKHTKTKLELEEKIIAPALIEKIKELRKQGFKININSGRGLYMLHEMFRPILSEVSLTYENGSGTWLKGKIIQHANSYNALKDLYSPLAAIRHKNIKGFEPKEFIITLHCRGRVPAVERLIKKRKDLYAHWTLESYDIGMVGKQTKGIGLRVLRKELGLGKKETLVIGDNVNDKAMLEEGGISVTADKRRVKGDYYTEIGKGKLPGEKLIDQILNS